MPDHRLPPELRRAVDQLGSADIMVGIPSYRNAATIGHVARAAQAGLVQYFPDLRPVLVNADAGSPDGIRVDRDGRVWSSAGDGVQIFGTDGRRIGKILVPEAPANLCFGGSDGKTLFITARTSLYSVKVLVTGAGR